MACMHILVLVTYYRMPVWMVCLIGSNYSGGPAYRGMAFPPLQGMGPTGMTFSGFTPPINPTAIPLGSLIYAHPPVAYGPHGTPVRRNDTDSWQRQRQRESSANMSAGGPSRMRTSPSLITAVTGLLDLGMENNHSDHLSRKGRWCSLDVIGLFVSTCFDVRASPNPLPPPSLPARFLFTPLLQDCSQPIAYT
jgi:hypothetical protein